MRTCLFLLLFPLFVTAQSTNKTYLTGGIMQANTYFYTSERYEARNSTSRSTSTGGNLHPGGNVGFSLGLSRAIHPRWEVAYRFNYTAATVTDTLRFSNFERFGLDSEQLRDRRYKAFWSEALLFWRIVGERSLADIQIGTGLTWMISSQDYDSGFSYNEDIEVYDYYHTFEKSNDFGIPVHFQIQYPVLPNVKVGGALQINSYFKGKRQQANFSAFVAYRW